MEPETANFTATIMAFHRATEMLRPESERVCNDTMAVGFLPDDWVDLLHDREKLLAFAAEKGKEFPGINGAVVARTRFMDETILQHYSLGMEQLVILGAGFDCRAYRIEGIDPVISVFEVDRPEMLAVKERLVKSILSYTPGHVTFVPMDLATADLETGLLDSGYNPAKSTLFILEGVTMYLPVEAIDRILDFIATRSGSYSGVVFDYLPPSVIDGTSQRTEGKSMLRVIQEHGEKFHFGIESDALEGFLDARGLDLKENVNAPELKSIFFKGQSAERPVSPLFWFAHAFVRK